MRETSATYMICLTVTALSSRSGIYSDGDRALSCMKRNDIYYILVFALVIMGTFVPLVKAAAGEYEIAGGGGISVNSVHATQGMILGAWITSLDKAFELRIEPNAEYIVTTSGQSMFLGGVSPVFRLGMHGQSLNPFLDVGLGLSIGSRKAFTGWNMGSVFFFSPTAGAGIKFGRSEKGVSLFARFLHHSNADLFPPNQSLNSVYLLLGYRF